MYVRSDVCEFELFKVTLESADDAVDHKVVVATALGIDRSQVHQHNHDSPNNKVYYLQEHVLIDVCSDQGSPDLLAADGLDVVVLVRHCLRPFPFFLSLFFFVESWSLEALFLSLLITL